MERIRKIPKKGETGLFERNYEFLKGALYVGYGINLRNPRNGKHFREVDIYKSADMRSTHLITLGRTRWGKTRFIERAEVDDIESGYSIFHLDPKQDYENLEAVIDAALRTDRIPEFVLFSPVYDEVSIRVNPFYYQLPDSISDLIKALAPPSKENFFEELGKEVGKAVSIGLYLDGKKEIRFVDLFQYTSLDDIEKLYQKVKNSSLDGYVEIAGKKFDKRELIADGMLTLNKLRKKDRTYWSKVNTTVEVILSQVSTGKVGKVFGRAYGNPLMDMMMNSKPFIFYALLGSLSIGKDPTSRIARLLNAATEKGYGKIAEKFQTAFPPISEYWDEGSITIYDGAFEKINKVGGLGGYIQIFTQSFSDFNLNVGEEGTKVFFDNADFVLMSILDQATADYFSKAAGDTYKSKMVWGKTLDTAMQEKVRLIPPDLFMRMPKGGFHAFVEGRWYRGYSPMLMDRRKILIEPLPYEEKRLRKYFAEKYNISEVEAGEIIKKYDVARDYDWIWKEGLADVWIDLKQFPYYKNYIQNYEEDTVSIINTIKKLDEEEENIEIDDEKLSKIIEEIKADKVFKRALILDGTLYLHFYFFKELFGKNPSKTKEITVNGKELKYVPVPLPEKLKDIHPGE